MAGPGGFQVSGTGHLPASVAVWKDGFRTPWQARRVPPEAVLIGKRRDPSFPLTGITGNGQGARPSEKGTARPSLCGLPVASRLADSPSGGGCA